MSYQDIELESSDVKISADGDLVITDKDDPSQSYNILLNTQYESDFRDPEYGFKLMELMQSDDPDKEELLELYTIEVLNQHPRTQSIDEILITNNGKGRYTSEASITLTNTDEERKKLEVDYTLEL